MAYSPLPDQTARSIRANIIGVEILITSNIEPSTDNDRMCKVGVGRLPFQLEPADHVETVRSDSQQEHRALMVQGIDHSVGAGDTHLAQCLVELDGLACEKVDAVETPSTLATCAAIQLVIYE